MLYHMSAFRICLCCCTSTFGHTCVPSCGPEPHTHYQDKNVSGMFSKTCYRSMTVRATATLITHWNRNVFVQELVLTARFKNREVKWKEQANVRATTRETSALWAPSGTLEVTSNLLPQMKAAAASTFVQPTLLSYSTLFSSDQFKIKSNQNQIKMSLVENHECELTFFPSDLRRESHRRSYRSLQWHEGA